MKTKKSQQKAKINYIEAGAADVANGIYFYQSARQLPLAHRSAYMRHLFYVKKQMLAALDLVELSKDQRLEAEMEIEAQCEEARNLYKAPSQS